METMSKINLKTIIRRKSQLEWRKKSIDAETKINLILKLSDQDFKAFIIKKLLQSIIYSLEIIEENNIAKTSQKEPNENYRTEKYNNWSKWLAEWA